MSSALYAAVEGGGTKFLCALATAPRPDAVVATARLDTADAASTLERVARFLAAAAAERGATICALGVASFGPIELDERSPRYGHMLDTPTPGWSHEPVLPRLAEALGLPLSRMRWDTDVNAAALGEARWGVGRDADPLVYVTVGTGLGAGTLVGGRPVHGNPHPEAGHIRLPRDPARDPFPGSCPFHGDCWEGLASGTAMGARWGVRGEELPDDHPAWTLEAHYLALGVTNLAMILSPQCVVLGGGVMAKPGLLDAVRAEVDALIGGYAPMPRLAAPGLDGRQGVLGAIALAEGARADARAILSR